MAHRMEHRPKFPLYFCRRFALVLFDKVSDRRLRLESFEALLHSSVIDICEEEGGRDLTLLHVRDKSRNVGDPGISDAMFPHRVHELRRFPCHARQVGIEIAVEIRFED